MLVPLTLYQILRIELHAIAHKRSSTRGGSRIGLRDDDEGAVCGTETFERITYNQSKEAKIDQLGTGFRKAEEEESIYLPQPKRATSICSKLMEYFFNY